MTGKDLFDAMNHIDERLIDEAENGLIPKTLSWIKPASIAACLCLMLFALRPYWNHPVTEGIAEQENQLIQDSANSTPGEHSPQELPSVLLYVREMTDTGFIATVAEPVDTDIFEPGMELHVVAADGTRHETADGKYSMSSEADYEGCYVMVQFIAYDRESATIVVNTIQEVSEKGCDL